MAKRYIIVKSFEPEGDYLMSLDPLASPDEENLTRHVDGAIVKARELEDDEVEKVANRPHIVAVEEDVEDHALQDNSFLLEFDQSALRYHELTQAEDGGHKGKGVVVGVGDTGIKQATINSHFDKRIRAKKSFVTGESVEDKNGHGDFCCVAATPSEAELVVAKVLSNAGSGSRSKIIEGIDWMVKQGATVISLSLGGSGASTAYDALFQGLVAQGVTIFAAAGNGGRENEPVGSPANSPYANAVAAINHRDNQIADFSCKGPEVDFAGAGVGIAYGGRNWSGTSMATPLVARTFSTILGKSEGPQVALKTMISKCRDTEAPATHDGVGVPLALTSISALEPEPVPVDPEPAPVEWTLTGVLYVAPGTVQGNWIEIVEETA